MAVRLPQVSRCEVTSCFFNREKSCHAPAINVGSDHPACDAFIVQGAHSQVQDIGKVGACHVAECRWNDALTCAATSIQVAGHAGHADCATYSPR